jgi:hypothetical protein
MGSDFVKRNNLTQQDLPQDYQLELLVQRILVFVLNVHQQEQLYQLQQFKEVWQHQPQILGLLEQFSYLA